METTVQINSSDNSEHIPSQNKHRNEVNIKSDEMKIQTAEDSAIFETQSSQEPKNISEDNGASHQLEPHKEQYEPESIDRYYYSYYIKLVYAVWINYILLVISSIIT